MSTRRALLVGETEELDARYDNFLSALGKSGDICIEGDHGRAEADVGAYCEGRDKWPDQGGRRQSEEEDGGKRAEGCESEEKLLAVGSYSRQLEAIVQRERGSEVIGHSSTHAPLQTRS